MSLFHYPKIKHLRKLQPRQYKRYQTYKRFLQAEFSRVCIYCRQPDTSAPNLNFGVDHYRPKSIFSSLNADYNNLYYCCGQCNSRKNNYWPKDEAVDPWIPNPCESIMSQHLKFEAASAKVKCLSDNGRFTEELLQLNDATLISYRQRTQTLVNLAEKEKASLQSDMSSLNDLYKFNKMTSDEYLQAKEEIDVLLNKITEAILGLKGETALPKYSKSRSP